MCPLMTQTKVMMMKETFVESVASRMKDVARHVRFQEMIAR